MGDVKNFLYAWCGKRKMTPTYEIRAVGNKNRQKFMCEVLKNTVYIYVVLRLISVLKELFSVEMLMCYTFNNVFYCDLPAILSL